VMKPHEAAAAAEQHIIDYATDCGCADDGELRNALEMLISKAAFAVAKCCSHDVAEEVLIRTFKAIVDAAAERERAVN